MFENRFQPIPDTFLLGLPVLFYDDKKEKDQSCEVQIRWNESFSWDFGGNCAVDIRIDGYGRTRDEAVKNLKEKVDIFIAKMQEKLSSEPSFPTSLEDE